MQSKLQYQCGLFIFTIAAFLAVVCIESSDFKRAAIAVLVAAGSLLVLIYLVAQSWHRDA